MDVLGRLRTLNSTLNLAQNVQIRFVKQNRPAKPSTAKLKSPSSAPSSLMGYNQILGCSRQMRSARLISYFSVFLSHQIGDQVAKKVETESLRINWLSIFGRKRRDKWPRLKHSPKLTNSYCI